MNTECFMKEVNEYVENICDEDLMSKVDNWFEMKNWLEMNVNNSSKWEEWLYDCLQKENLVTFGRDVNNYKTELFKVIKAEFRKNGISSSRGSLTSSTGLKRKFERLFEKKANAVTREDVILFAYGLDLNLEDVEYYFNKILLQMGFNAKDYREVIAYYVLKCYRGEARIKKYDELVNYYKGLDIVENTKTHEIGETEYAYRVVSSLHNDKENVGDKQIKEILEELRREFDARYSTNNADDFSGIMIDTIVEGWKIGDKKEIASYNEYVYIRRLCDDKKEAYEVFKESEELLSYDVLYQIFDDPQIDLQKDTDKVTESIIENSLAYYKRQLDDDKIMSRKALLMILFVKFVCSDGTIDSVKPIERIDRFEESVGNSLESNHMYGELYYKDPFELFLILCLCHKMPYEYFLANWYKLESYIIEN